MIAILLLNKIVILSFLGRTIIQNMSASIKIELNSKLFIRDPEHTVLGRNIVSESIIMIDELGFEVFTFKKLAIKLKSTEASIYRYFENKHKLLVYLISWYWVYVDYKITFNTHFIDDPQEKLKVIINIISEVGELKSSYSHVNEALLYNIVVSESSKAFLTKEVDSDNKEGFFGEYKSLCHKIAKVVSEINPSYPYPHALVSTLFEASKKQVFFSQHLPSLTESRINRTDRSEIASFLNSLAFSAIFSSYK